MFIKPILLEMLTGVLGKIQSKYGSYLRSIKCYLISFLLI